MTLLDTDHLTLLKYPTNPRCATLIARLQASPDQEIGTTIISKPAGFPAGSGIAGGELARLKRGQGGGKADILNIVHILRMSPLPLIHVGPGVFLRAEAEPAK